MALDFEERPPSPPSTFQPSRSNLGSIRESIPSISLERARGESSEQYSSLLAPRVSSFDVAPVSSSQVHEQEGRSLQSITIPEAPLPELQTESKLRRRRLNEKS